MLKAAFAIIAVIIAATLFINLIRLIAWIILIGAITSIVITVIIWALATYLDRKADRRAQATTLARSRPAAPSGYTPAVQRETAAGLAEIALLGRVLSKTEERIARQFAQAVAEGQDLAAINELISKVLRGQDT